MLRSISLVATCTLCLLWFYAQVKKTTGPSLGLTGDPKDVTTPTKGGVALIGGGGNVMVLSNG